MSERTRFPLLWAAVVLVLAAVLAPALHNAALEINRGFADVWPVARPAGR